MLVWASAAPHTSESAEEIELPKSQNCVMRQPADMFISTLRKIIEARGGELEVRAILPDGVVRINQFAEVRKPCAVSGARRRQGHTLDRPAVERRKRLWP